MGNPVVIIVMGVMMVVGIFWMGKHKEMKISQTTAGTEEKIRRQPEIEKNMKIGGAAKEEIGKEVICPVTKQKFSLTPETKTLIYEGKNYYFCCPDCTGEFIKNPEQYLQEKTK